MQYLIKLNNLDETMKFARSIAQAIVPNFIITLSGELGSGKTTIVREVLHSLGIKGSIKSPTYTIVEPYKINNLDLYHFDLYRFNDPEEWFESGFDEYFEHHSICFIEWAEKAIEFIPVIDWQISIKVAGIVRQIEVKTDSEKGKICLNQLIKLVGQ